MAVPLAAVTVAANLAQEAAATIPANATQGVTIVTNLSESTLIIAAGVMMLLALIILFVFKRFIVNSIAGIVAILVLGLFGVHITLNAVSVLVIAVLGLVGVALLIILKLAGVAL